MWKPIFDRPLRARAFTAIEAVATGVLAHTEAGTGRSIVRGPATKAPLRKMRDPSLGRGMAGVSILYAYLARARTGSNDSEIALRLLTQAAEAVSAVPMNLSLFAGFTGVGWSVAHLRRWLLSGDDDSTEAIDQILRKQLKVKSWHGPYDLVNGLVGLGVYALEQLPRPLAIECLERVIDHLDEIAECGPAGITWFTSPDMLTRAQRKMFPKGHYDLGLAHGVTGVIAFLGRVCSLNFGGAAMLDHTQAKAKGLLDGAVRWLLAQRLTGKQGSVYPYFSGPGVDQTPSRVAWCYGDLGIATALLAAAVGGKKPEWREEALRLARNVARRPASVSCVIDCGLCHGGAGVGHLFNRLFQGTGEPLFRQAALRWFQRTLRLRRVGQGIAGFFALEAGPKGRLKTVRRIGLLEGATGVALALLAAATNAEPNWDRMMMLWVPTNKQRRRARAKGALGSVKRKSSRGTTNRQATKPH